jgi:hypothetical protein
MKNASNANAVAATKRTKGLFANTFLGIRNTIAQALVEGRPILCGISGLPYNAATGTPYSGINVLMLSVQAMLTGGSTAFVGHAGAFKKGWTGVPADSALKYTGCFNGFRSSKPADATDIAATVNPETGEVTSKEKVRPFMGTFLLMDAVKAYGAEVKAPAPMPDVANKAFALLKTRITTTEIPGISQGFAMIVGEIVALATTTTNLIKSPFIGEPVATVATWLSPKTVSTAGDYALTLLEDSGMNAQNAAPSGKDEAANATLLAEAIKAAQEKLTADGLDATERALERETAKLLPKPASVEPVYASSIPEMLLARRVCVNW